MSVYIVALMSCIAYVLGTVKAFEFNNKPYFFDYFLTFPADDLMLICGLLYTSMWYFDHEWEISDNLTCKIEFTIQIFILLALFLRVSFKMIQLRIYSIFMIFLSIIS